MSLAQIFYLFCPFITLGLSGLPKVFVGLHNPGRINCNQCNDGTLSWTDGETAYVNQYLDVSFILKRGSIKWTLLQSLT